MLDEREGQAEIGHAREQGVVHGVLAGAILTGLVSISFVFVQDLVWRRAAVEHGAAEYDPQSGAWHWIEE